MTAPTPSEVCGNHGCTLPIHTGPCYITRAESDARVAEAERGQHWPSNCCPQCGTVNLTLDDRIVEAVREEREACYQLSCDLPDAWKIAAAIRTRGDKK